MKIRVIGISGILFLFLFLTVNPLLFQSYWENEADYLLNAQLPIHLIPGSLAPDQSPLFFFSLHFWIRLFGNSEAATRSLSLVFSLAAIYCLYRLCIVLFQKKSVGLLAASFLATSSFFVEFSQETKHWTMFVFLTLISLLFLYRWFQENRLKDFFLFVLFGILNLYTCLYAFFVFPLLLVFAMGWGVWKGFLQKKIFGGALLLSGMVIVERSAHLWGGLQYVSSRGAQWGLPAEFPDFFITLHRQLFYYTEQLPIPFPVLAGLITAYLFFLVGLFRMRTREVLVISSLFLLPLIGSYLVADASSIRNRYFIHLIPLFWLSTSFGIFSVRSIRLRGLAVGLILISSLASLFNYFSLHHKEDWKSAVAFLTPQLQAKDIVIVTPYWVKAGFQFYSPFRWIAADQPRLEELGLFKRAWLLSAYGDASVPLDRFRPFLQKNFNKISVRGFDLSGAAKINSPTAENGFNFREALESAQVFEIPFNGGTSTPFPYLGREAFYLDGEERGEKGEGLLFDHWRRQPLSPGRERWHVVARTVQKGGGVPREAIWAHPPQTGRLVIRYPKVRLGKELSGFFGLTDLSVQHGKAPVRFSIFVDQKKVYEVLKGNSEGWKEFSIDTSTQTGKEAEVEFRIEAANNRWRHFCFNAFAQ